MRRIPLGALQMFLFMASDAVNIEGEYFFQICEFGKQKRHHNECDLHYQEIGMFAHEINAGKMAQ
ncbi:hypothetical protein D3C77_394980 [compost metagenome]